MSGAYWFAFALLWLSGLVYALSYHHEHRLRLALEGELRDLMCGCGAVLASQVLCVEMAGWHHGRGAGHCHPLDTVDR